MEFGHHDGLSQQSTGLDWTASELKHASSQSGGGCQSEMGENWTVFWNVEQK